MSHCFVNIKMCLFSPVLYSFLFYFVLFLQVDSVHSEKNEKRKAVGLEGCGLVVT